MVRKRCTLCAAIKTGVVTLLELKSTTDMRFSLDLSLDPKSGVLVEAKRSVGIGHFVCPKCRSPTVFCKASANGKRAAYFRHKHEAQECDFGVNSNDAPEDGVCEPAPYDTREMSPWHAEWQNLATADVHKEARGVGEDGRPRDLADYETGDIVELQHSHIADDAFAARNGSAPRFIVWIFDATGTRLWNYGDCTDTRGDGVSFCEDGFRIALPTSENVIVLFHCADGSLRTTACDTPCQLDLPNDGKVYVRLLKEEIPLNARAVLDRFFGSRWPLQEWTGHTVAKNGVRDVTNGHVKVISEEGRLFFDGIHRRLFTRFPTAPLTVFQGPPGAGKTTLLKRAICTWAYKRPCPHVLVVTFNKANQEVLEREINSRTVKVKTLDSLCALPIFYKKGARAEFDPVCTDRSLLQRYFPGEASNGKYGLINKMKHNGGAGCADVMRHQLQHPRADFVLCSQHKKLTMASRKMEWTAGLDTFPLCDMVENASTFASRRYVCDRDELLREPLSKYDVVIVDEMQDLLSAQEQRLIRQAPCPVVLIGDNDQRINDFKNVFNHRGCAANSECCMPEEREPELPLCIEFYGTHRLDAHTTAFLEDMMHVRMHSYRDESERSSVRWQVKMQVPGNSLLLCRQNRSVIETAMKTDGMKVVGGDKLKNELKAKRWDKSDETPFAKYAQRLSDKELDRVSQFLVDNSISLPDFSLRTDISVASTVHQCKGFECDHVAVHDELLNCEEEEKAILYVALTRHRKSLTILTNPVGHGGFYSHKRPRESE